MTNLGPLTTTFTPIGPDCSSTFEGSLKDNRWLQYGVPGNPSSACLPGNFNNDVGYFYSPGLCPSGYTSACTGWVSATTKATWEAETTCCPSGYSCRSDRGVDPFACSSAFDGPRTFVLSLYNIEIDSAGVNTKIDNGKSTTTVFMNEAVFGYAVVVRTAPIGGSTTAINSATGSVSEHSPGTGGVTATGRTEIGENGNGNTEQGVSIEVAAGIGIGIGLGVILLTGTMLYLVRLYRRRLRGSQLKDHYGIKQGPMPSSHSSQHLELPESQGKPQEMGTDREPGELSAEV